MYYSGARPTQNGSYSLFLPSTITDIVEYRHDLDFILVPALERAMRLYIQILSATLPTACVYSVHTRRYVLSFCLTPRQPRVIANEVPVTSTFMC